MAELLITCRDKDYSNIGFEVFGFKSWTEVYAFQKRIVEEFPVLDWDVIEEKFPSYHRTGITNDHFYFVVKKGVQAWRHETHWELCAQTGAVYIYYTKRGELYIGHDLVGAYAPPKRSESPRTLETYSPSPKKSAQSK